MEPERSGATLEGVPGAAEPLLITGLYFAESNISQSNPFSDEANTIAVRLVAGNPAPQTQKTSPSPCTLNSRAQI